MQLLRFYLCALAASLILASLTGCGERGSPEDTVNLAIPADLRNLDPAQAWGTYETAIAHGLAAGLLDYDEGTELKGELAETWSVSDDRKRYAFTLRPGVRFGNGRVVTAKDFKYSLERVLDPKTKSPGSELFLSIQGAKGFREGKQREVSGIQATDDTHLVFQLEQPSAVFLYQLATTFAAPVAKEAVEKDGERFGSHPVGAGPYHLEKWVRGQYLELASTDNPSPSVDKPEDPVKRPKWVHLDLNVPETTQLTRFMNQSLDITSGVPAVEISRLIHDRRGEGRIATAVVDQTWYMGMNTQQPPFNDVRVRQAVNYAVDRQKQVQLAGLGRMAFQILPPPMPGFVPVYKPYDHNVNRARELMREAGHADGASATMWIAADETWRRRAQGIQADLREIGLNLELREADLATYFKEYKKESAQCWYGGWFPDYPDPSSFLDVLFNSKNITPTGSLNSTRYSNPQVDAMLNRAALMPPGYERLKVYQQVQEKVLADAAWAPLYYEAEIHLRQLNIRGAMPHPVWRYIRLARLGKIPLEQ